MLLLAIMNPAAIIAGFLVGRRADQVQKIVVAGFVAGIAGVMFAGLLMLTGLFPPKVRSLSGVFVAAMVVGIVFGWIGFATRRKGPDVR
ncbi:MAG: hypothetical protein AB7O71_09355 [Hyphomicrobiaceae bacterium]